MEKNNIYIGKFISIKESNKPGVIISYDFNDLNNKILVSIHEYGGDYIWIDKNNIYLDNVDNLDNLDNLDNIDNIDNIDNYYKLSILANFNDWFYDQHKDIYQNLIINTLLQL